MARTSTAPSDGTATQAGCPPAVEILKRLDADRTNEACRAYGSAADRKRIAEQVKKQTEHLSRLQQRLSKGHNRKAEDQLIDFLKAGGVIVDKPARLAVRKTVAAVLPRGGGGPGEIPFPNLLKSENPICDAYQKYQKLGDRKVSSKDSASVWHHPIGWLCTEIMNLTGIPRDHLLWSAYVANTPGGMANLAVDGEDAPDFPRVAAELRELDSNGSTAYVFRELIRKYPAQCERSGLLSSKKVGIDEQRVQFEQEFAKNTPGYKPSGTTKKDRELKQQMLGKYLARYLDDKGASLRSFARSRNRWPR